MPMPALASAQEEKVIRLARQVAAKHPPYELALPLLRGEGNEPTGCYAVFRAGEHTRSVWVDAVWPEKRIAEEMERAFA